MRDALHALLGTHCWARIAGPGVGGCNAATELPALPAFSLPNPCLPLPAPTPHAGTHDNQTSVGWWKRGAQVEEKALIRQYTGMTDDDVAYCFIREALKSCAHTAVVSMQVGGRGLACLGVAWCGVAGFVCTVGGGIRRRGGVPACWAARCWCCLSRKAASQAHAWCLCLPPTPNPCTELCRTAPFALLITALHCLVLHCLQDIMRLDDTARMNTPGLAAGNWTWRVGGSDVWRQLADEQAELAGMVHRYDRAPPGGLPQKRSSGRSGSAEFGR